MCPVSVCRKQMEAAKPNVHNHIGAILHTHIATASEVQNMLLMDPPCCQRTTAAGPAELLGGKANDFQYMIRTQLGHN